MIRNSRRVVVLAVAGAVAIAPVISGCGAGMSPQSAAPTRLTEGVNVAIPMDKKAATQIDLRNMFLLGAQDGQLLKAGADVPLYGVLINQVKGRPDRLVAVSSPAFGQAKIAGGSVTLPPASVDGMGGMVSLLGKPQPKASASATPSGGQTGQPSGTASPRTTAGTGATPNTTSTPTSENTTSPQESGLPVTPGPGDQPLVVLSGLTQDLVAGSTVPVRMQFEHAGAIEFQVPVAPRQEDFATYPLATPTTQPSGTPGATGSPSPGATGSPSPGTSETPGATGSPSPGASETPGASGGH
ncbi:hypothetical protein AB0K34_10705 [Actinomadura sp. NPDC049382]|uniref:hypothetical protein n=1 Tax=Actinomadura sp. NPDC049382 TaxID=3158220 RepID=UPI00342842BA